MFHKLILVLTVFLFLQPVPTMAQKITKTEDEWKKILPPEQYHILREKGTERAFSGEYNDFKGKGIFQCAACGNPLFESSTKFESGTGWPSFWDPVEKEAIQLKEDNSLWMKRTEVICNQCDSHLGHVFDDGPPPTNLRYCINSLALKFQE